MLFAQVPPSPPGLEIIVREPASGLVLLQITLQFPGSQATPSFMRFSPSSPGEGTDAVSSQPASPVAGRIDARPGEVAAALKSWHERLKGRRLKCARDYVAVIQKALRDEGWSLYTDYTYEAVTGYLSAKVAAGDWKGVTYNRNLTVFKSFTKHLCKVRGVPDFLEDADWAEDDREDSIRAATLAEARQLVHYAWMRFKTDRKCTVETPLSLCALLGMGLRPRETDKWRWKHLKLDCPHEHVWWTRDIQKNKKEQHIPMSKELAELFREHRARRLAGPKTHVRRCKFKASSIWPIDPRDPEAFVFGETISQTCFRKYVRACGLSGADGYGKRLAPRSCRKFYKTEMKRVGVDGDSVRLLMRHAPHADEGYFTPTMEDLAASADRCPALWPAGLGTSGRLVDNSPLHELDLTPSSGAGNPCASSPHAAPPPQPLEKPLRDDPSGIGLESNYAGFLGGFFEPLSVQPVLSLGVGGVESSLFTVPLSSIMAQTRFINEPDSNALADLFGALERLLRGAAHDSPQQTTSDQAKSG